MARVLWKGAIAFGLVNIPVSLYAGAKENELDFDLLDRRDFAPIGYQRINKKTGRAVEWENIVKAYATEAGEHVVMSDEDFRRANPVATQTVEILCFVDAGVVEPQYFQTPYRLVPAKRAEKGYALLRETLKRTGKIGIAQLVIRTKQHLAALMPIGDMLLLETLRYADEILPADEFELPKKTVGITDKELQMAERLVQDMTEPWEPAKFKDTYRDDLLARIQEKVAAGETHLVTEPAKEKKAPGGAQVIDLMAALKRSLESGARKSTAAPARKTPAKAPARRAAAKRKRA